MGIQYLCFLFCTDGSATLGVPSFRVAIPIGGHLHTVSLYGNPHVDWHISTYIVLLLFQIEKQAKIGLHNLTIKGETKIALQLNLYKRLSL
jgi:hypothetical protein